MVTTQYANASYQEVIDLHTESDKVSVVGIHTPNSDTPYNMLKGFWMQFKKFRYNGCSISLVPAARLPADPLQVSYEAGEPTIDPRDMLNPILFHGCHGDDMGAILNALYTDDNASSFIDMIKSDSADLNIFPQSIMQGDNAVEIYEALYYKAMTDKTWLKAHPQRGFRKSGLRPMVYSVASMRQMASIPDGLGALGPVDTIHSEDGQSYDIHGASTGNPAYPSVESYGEYNRPTVDIPNNTIKAGVVYRQQLITPRIQPLGWMDTRNVIGLHQNSAISYALGSGQTLADGLMHVAEDMQENLDPVLVPKIFMGMIMLPPAYKTEQYFRLIISHSFSFAKFRGASMQYNPRGMLQKAYNVFDFNDPEAAKLARDKTVDLEKKENDENDTKEV